MAQPTPYTRQFDFSDFQTVNPARPLPGSELDAELDRVKLTSDQTLANLAKIQRDDGRLNNQSVTPESLSAATLALIAQGEYNPRGFWAAATAYAVGDLVEFNAATFLALVAHTSDTQFTTDQTAGRWLLIANGALQGGGQAIDLLEGDGTETVFNLSFTYNGDEAATVFVGGVAQIPGQDFTIVGDTLTFVSAPPAPVVPGRKNVMVRGTGLEAQLAADNATAAANNAANSATAAQNSATAASNSAGAALASENAASASEAASATSEGNAATSASNAATSATNSANSAAAALASENAAAGSASAAATSATSAATSATTATNQATTATNQATAASNSASAAATSATNASNSASNASGSATVATQQATIATNAANAAGGSESNAAASASQAATSASNASASASSASSSASSANTSAVNAAASATSASNSATAAGNSAAAALASQNAAATSESNAAASATAANQSKIDTEQVAERYQGDKASAPTLRNNGSALQAGDLYFDTVLGEMRVYDGSVWKAAGSTVNGTAVRQAFTATAGQTTFALTGGYDAGFADVYLNGVKLVNGVDVNVTSGTDVVLTVGAAAGDSVDVIAYGAFVLANHYTRAEADAEFLTKNSPSYTGTLTGGTGVINIGSGQIYKDASGNVGIGTSNTSNRLNVEGGNISLGGQFSNNSLILSVGNSNRQEIVFAQPGYAKDSAAIRPVDAGGTWARWGLGFFTGNASNTTTPAEERMRITRGGNVGIGTSSPAEQLHITGNFRIGSSVLATPSGSAPAYLCRAWVNFNGNGTPAIRASGNVSSVTRNGTGDYTVNFTTAMPDANYSAVFGSWGNAATVVFTTFEYSATTRTASAIRILNIYTSPTVVFDPSYVSVAIFR